MRRAAQVDANQEAIVSALRKVGASVQSLAQIGHGCPDLLVGFRGRNFVMEVKQRAERGKVRPSDKGAKLNEAQEQWAMFWRGQVDVVRCAEDAFRVIGLQVDPIDAARAARDSGMELGIELRKKP